MGCCNQKLQMPAAKILIEKLQIAIEDDSPSRITHAIRLLSKLDDSSKYNIDSPIIQLKGFSLSILSYSVWLGMPSAFQCIIEVHKASVEQMESQFHNRNTSAIEIICQRGFYELLNVYLPIYVENFYSDGFTKNDHANTIEFDKTLEVLPKSIYTPIHKACELGNISILISVFNFFKDKDSIPYTLDMAYQEEHYGENCVLIACKIGNYSMIKFLNEIVKADFHIKNKSGENAINVLLAGCRKKPGKAYFECMVYLVEVIKVDITCGYEESLLLVQDRDMVRYIEKELKKLGINVDKQSLEEENRIKIGPISRSDLEPMTDHEQEFFVRDYVESYNDRSALSSIYCGETHEAFFSVLGNNTSILKNH